MDINSLLNYARENKASDLHLTPGNPPIVRTLGEIHRLNVSVLTKEEVKEMTYSIMTPHQKEVFERDYEVDFSLETNDKRYRANAYTTSNGTSLAIRLVSEKVRTMEELRLPVVTERFVRLNKGLVVVTGPTGSGKSTTLAALINDINRAQSKHIITIEDPIEYRFKSDKCLINQREIGAHTRSFATALKNALREDPDIIMIGELRDLETIQLALTAAETGHLVFGTLHTSSAAKTIDRIIDVFPAGDKPMVRTMLASSIEGVIAQTLLVKKDSNDMVAAYEVMVANSAIRNLIRENKIPQITSQMQIGTNQGMIVMEQAIKDLLSHGIISEEEARYYHTVSSETDESKRFDTSLGKMHLQPGDNEF